VSAQPKASAIPITRSSPKPRTIGTGDSRSTRKPAPVARQAVAMVGPPRAAARGAASRAVKPSSRITSSWREWNWIA